MRRVTSASAEWKTCSLSRTGGVFVDVGRLRLFPLAAERPNALRLEVARDSVALGNEHAADIVDLLIVIGARSKITADEARACSLHPASILELEDNQAAIEYLDEMIEPENIVLIKGSLSCRMSEIVSALTVPIGLEAVS